MNEEITRRYAAGEREITVDEDTFVAYRDSVPHNFRFSEPSNVPHQPSLCYKDARVILRAPTRQDTFTKVLQALMDAYGVRVTSIHEWSDDANFYILEKVLFEGDGIRLVADESLNP